MSEKNEKIDWSLLTPEAAYRRITDMADKISANYPKPIYDNKSLYWFTWDKDSNYSYTGSDNGRHLFERVHDHKIAILTKYSFLPQDQPNRA